MSVAEISGVHPYADKFPMLCDAELDELAESIKVVGLLHPVVVTTDGLVLDGRNRLEACTRADVTPAVEVYDGDDHAEFVIASNVARRNMTTGARAMSTALVLAADGRRGNGRWKRNSVPSDNRDSSVSDAWEQALRQAGSVIDHSPDLARKVVDGDLALDAAYRQAIDARDAERRKLEQAERIAAEEADARAFIEQSDPSLAAQVGDVFESYAEAQAVWEKRNREEAARLAREKAEKELQEKADRENAEDRVRQMLGALARLEGLELPEWREFTRECIARYPDAAPPTQRHVHDPSWLRTFARWVTAYADELES